MRVIDETPYTSAELKGALPQWPERGVICPKCGTVIPQFAALTEEESARLRSLIVRGQKLMAMRELEFLTGAPTRWAKIWVLHSGRADAVDSTAPCPFCGRPLKTARARQCAHCLMDWHDPKNPRSLTELCIK